MLRQKSLSPPLFSDAYIVFITVSLVLFGLLMIYSTTGVLAQERFGEPLFFVKRQIVAAIIGFAAMIFCSRIPIGAIKKYSSLFFFASVFLLALTLFPPLAETAGGARRWINLGFVRFQPGELAKVFFVIFMAGFFARRESRLHTISDGIIKPVLLLCAIGLLFILQPDFGSIAILAIVVFCMAAVAGVRVKHMLAGALVLLLVLGSLILISPYRLTRVMAFLSPWSDASGSGYQLIQSLIAVGAGGFSGAGIGASQQKLFFLPAAHTDFIFAVVAEELGFLGALLVLTAFIVLFWRGLKLARKFVDDTFLLTLAVGLTFLIIVPTFLNIGVVLGMLPTKGLVLPLVAYGGSSLVSSLIAIGFLLSLAASHDSPSSNYALNGSRI